MVIDLLNNHFLLIRALQLVMWFGRVYLNPFFF